MLSGGRTLRGDDHNNETTLSPPRVTPAPATCHRWLSWVNQTVPLQNPGSYTFTMRDAYGDGMCCDYGDGMWMLSVGDGIYFATGGTFIMSESVSFDVPIISPPPSPPPPPPSPPPLPPHPHSPPLPPHSPGSAWYFEVEVACFTDDYASQTSWRIHEVTYFRLTRTRSTLTLHTSARLHIAFHCIDRPPVGDPRCGGRHGGG